MAGPNLYDLIINGSFDALGGTQPPSTGSPYLTADERQRLEQQVAASKSLQAPYVAPPVVASAPTPNWNTPNAMDLAAIQQWNAARSPAAPETMLAYGNGAPASPAAAAAAAMGQPTVGVTASLKEAPRGGLLDLIFGPSKNGQSGLAGLLGGPNAGGLLGVLTTGAPKATTAPPRYQQAGRDSNGDKLGSFEKDAYGNPGWMF